VSKRIPSVSARSVAERPCSQEFQHKFGARVRPEELRPLLGLMERQKIRRGLVVTRNKVDKLTIDGRQVDLLPFYLL
jgi:hypothetical protein